MSRPMIIGASALAVAAVCVLTGVTSANGSPPEQVVHLTVVEHAVTDTVVDTGPAGDSLGDLLAFHNPVFNAANKHKVGTDNGSCVRTVVGAAYECEWTMTLAHGSLVVQGPFYDAADSTMAITGGTGRYRSAGGQMVLHARNAEGSASDFRYSITG